MGRHRTVSHTSWREGILREVFSSTREERRIANHSGFIIVAHEGSTIISVLLKWGLVCLCFYDIYFPVFISEFHRKCLCLL